MTSSSLLFSFDSESLCFVSPAAQQIHNSTTGDYFSVASFYFGALFLAIFWGAVTCLEIFKLLWDECRGRSHIVSVIFKSKYSLAVKRTLFFVVLVGEPSLGLVLD